MMLWLRSLIFNIILYGWTTLICVGLFISLLLPRRCVMFAIHVWALGIEWIEEYVGGIRYRVLGREHIPPGVCIIAAKHQSAWETFKLHLLFDDPAIVLKEELLKIPIWGLFVRRSGMIPINRSARGIALTGMLVAARKAVAAGRTLVIFPQGTRTAVGEIRSYKSGVTALYQELNLPVVPMALNSGRLWGKNSFIKRPGLITIQFLPPIMPGLPRDEMTARLKAELETASDKLNLLPING